MLDIGFMAEHNLMDYSLLLITEKNPDFKEKDERQGSSTALGGSGSEVAEQENQLKLALSRIPEEVHEDQEDSKSFVNNEDFKEMNGSSTKKEKLIDVNAQYNLAAAMPSKQHLKTFSIASSASTQRRQSSANIYTQELIN